MVGRGRTEVAARAVALATGLALAGSIGGCGADRAAGSGTGPAGPSTTSSVAPRPATTASPTPAYRAARPTDEALRSAFQYDASRPLDMVLQPATDDQRPGVQVAEVSYDDGSGGRASALLVRPVGRTGRLPAVIFAHGSDAPVRTFLDEAAELVSSGAVALLTTTSFDPRGSSEQDLAMVRKAVVLQRRGLDLLANLPDVDQGRLAVVGHSWGATQAAILAGVEPRLRAAVVAATGPRFSEFLWSGSGGTGDRGPYLDRLAVVDPIWHLALPGHRTVLLQHGTSDRIVGQSEADELHVAAAEPKQVKAYQAGHGLDREPAARGDRLAFLTEVLR